MENINGAESIQDYLTYQMSFYDIMKSDFITNPFLPINNQFICFHITEYNALFWILATVNFLVTMYTHGKSGKKKI